MRLRESRKKRYILVPFCALILLSIPILLYWKDTNREPVRHRLQWWLSAIEWDEKRTKETGKGIRIAVLDSGIDAAHPDLIGRIESEYKVSGLEENSTASTLHGTAVAGIIAGSPSHEKGILGVAVQASILSVDVTDHENGSIEVEHLVEGIQYAISQSVDIIHISAGVKNHSEQLHKAIKEAYEAGIVIVAACGNFMDNDMLYPAKYDEVLAVGSRAKSNDIISPAGTLKKKVIYLPGENIVTASESSGYTGLSGTSAAAPILSGIIALMMEKDRSRTNEKIISYFNGYSEPSIKVRDCIQLK